MNEKNGRKLDCLGDLDSIDKSELKLKLIMEFSKAIFNTDTVTDLMWLVYRNPVCQHQCGISHILMSVMQEFGIDDQDYDALFVDLENESDIDDDHEHIGNF